jgi:hypothetical protein
MLENKIKRTIIVTVDVATITECNKDIQKFLNLQNYLAKMQITPECRIGDRVDGFYFRREIEI